VLGQPRPRRLGLGHPRRPAGQRRRARDDEPAHGDPGRDSTYVVNCFRDGWWKGWIARGWVTSAKKPVVSRDLWEPLITTVNERGDVSFRWTKGHSGDEMNDLVDRLAVERSKSVSAS
jgi:ribonuclease HI